MKPSPYLWLSGAGVVLFLYCVAVAARRSTEHSNRAVSAWNLRVGQLQREAEPDPQITYRATLHTTPPVRPGEVSGHVQAPRRGSHIDEDPEASWTTWSAFTEPCMSSAVEHVLRFTAAAHVDAHVALPATPPMRLLWVVDDGPERETPPPRAAA